MYRHVKQIFTAHSGTQGTIFVIVLHAVVFALWIVLNSAVATVVWAFDPFPFRLLRLVVSFEAIVLLLYVLVNQRRQSSGEADVRKQLQVRRLVGKENSTKILQLVQRLCELHGVRLGAAVQRQPVAPKVEELLRQLRSDVSRN